MGKIGLHPTYCKGKRTNTLGDWPSAELEYVISTYNHLMVKKLVLLALV